MNVLLLTSNKKDLIEWGTFIKDLGYYLLTLNDIKNNSEPNCFATAPIVNALSIAKHYFYKLGTTTVAIDKGFYLNGLSREDQFSLFNEKAIDYNKSNKTRKIIETNNYEQFKRIEKALQKMGGYTTGYIEEAIAVVKGDNDIISRTYTMKKEFKIPTIASHKDEDPIKSFIYYSESDKFKSQLLSEERDWLEDSMLTKQKRFIKQSLQ